MASLLGSKPNQVSTNGELGTLAFQDSNAVNITGGTVDVSAGTAALPTLGTTGDPNTGVFFPAADTVAVATNGVEALRVDASGNLLVGTTSAFRKINIGGTSNAHQSFSATSFRRYTIGSESNGFVVFDDTAGVYRTVIDANGNVGIGTTAPNNRLQVQAGNFANVAAAITQGSGTTGNASQLLLQDGSFTLGAVTGYGTAYGSSLNSATMVSSNAVITSGAAANYSSSNFATRYVQANGTHQWGTAPSGTAGNAITFTQAMTLDASGNLLVGTTSTAGAASNGKVITNGGVLTNSGNLSVATATATTIFSITAANRGRYEVTAMVIGSGLPLGYTAIATVIWDGSGGRVVANNGTNLTITLSGSDVQVTQTAGSSQTIYWSFQRLALF